MRSLSSSPNGVTLFELGVACEVFGGDWSAMFGVPWYRSFVCAITPGPVTVDAGFQMLAADGVERIRDADTVIVLPTVPYDRVPAGIPEVLRQAHARGSRIVSLCTGAFALAAAGLLDGRRATTHWTECDGLARRYPKVTVDPAVLFVDEGDVLTSAGSAASIDLCLHVVRQDYGTEIATQLARQLVVPPQRDGGQAQYIDAPMPELRCSSLFAPTPCAGSRITGRADNGRRSGGSVRHEPADARPAVPGQHRHDPLPVAPYAARPARPSAPRNERSAARFSRGEKRLSEQAANLRRPQPGRAHQSAQRLPAHPPDRDGPARQLTRRRTWSPARKARPAREIASLAQCARRAPDRQQQAPVIVHDTECESSSDWRFNPAARPRTSRHHATRRSRSVPRRLKLCIAHLRRSAENFGWLSTLLIFSGGSRLRC